MDTNSKANFINSVASGEQIPCLKCNALNRAAAKFCGFCGSSLQENVVVETKDEPFAPIKKDSKEAPAKAAEESKEIGKPDKIEVTRKIEKPVGEIEESESVFAKGLPAWDIEPPQVVVRRKKSR